MSDTPLEKREIFDALVIEHHVRLRAFVRSLGVASDWVDDVAQDAFMTAFREWDSYDQARDFGRWLRGIAANIVRNEIRKDARRRRILHTELADFLLKRYAAAQEEPVEPVALESVRQCLDELAPKSRDVVQGRYRDGMQAPQLAHQLNLSATNVRQILVRARRQLKQCIEHRLVEDA